MNPRHKRSPRNLLLGQALPDWATGGGIFAALDSNGDMPWHSTDIVQPTALDIAYIGQRSGQKFVAPIVYNWIDSDGVLNQNGVAAISAALQFKYRQKWTHLWNLYTAQYGPLDTISMRETGSRQSTKAGTSSGTTSIDDETSRALTRSGTNNETLTIDDATSRNLLRNGSNNETLTINDSSNRTLARMGSSNETQTIDDDTVVETDARVDIKNTRTDDLIEKNNGTDNTDNTGKDTTTNIYGHELTTKNTGTEINAHQVTGFNSTNPLDSTKDTRTPDLTEKTTNGGTDTSELQHGHKQDRTFQSTKKNTGTQDNEGYQETDSRVTTNVDGSHTTNGTISQSDLESLTDTGTHTTAGTTSQTDTEAGTSTGTHTTSGRDSISDNETTGTTGTHSSESENNETYTESYSNNRTGTFRYAPAELMEMDRAFWLTDYFGIVFDDLDDFLCLRVYPERIPNTLVI